MGKSGAYPGPWARGNAGGAGHPRTPRSRGGPIETAVPATPGAGFATAFPATWPAAAPASAKRSQRYPCDPRRRLPPSWARRGIDCPLMPRI